MTDSIRRRISAARRSAALLGLAALAALALAGCGGLMGGTKPFVVTAAPPGASATRHRIEMGGVTIAPGANDLRATGTYHVGKFDEEDRKILARSFVDSLATVAWPANDSKPWSVHVHLRRYLVAHSNNDGGVLACVAWALADASGHTLHADQFYSSMAADDAEHRTLGGVKNDINKAVVARIVRESVEIASASDPSKSRPKVDVPFTYDTIQDAADRLPKRLTSLMGLPTFATRKVDWEEVDPPGQVDWTQLLGGG